MLKSLQAGRAIAAIFVLLYHLGRVIAADKYFGIPGFEIPFSFGGAGVEFFFVLSGFIITTAHRKDFFSPERFPSYLSKRLIRIYPVYWIIFLTVYAAAYAAPHFRVALPSGFSELSKALLLIPQMGVHPADTTAPLIIVAWTLQYEMVFYLTFGLLILSRWISMAAGSAFVLFFLYFRFFPAEGLVLTFLSSPFILLFLMGAVLALQLDAAHFTLRRSIRYGWLGLVLFCAKALDTILLNNTLESVEIYIYGLASTLIILGLVKAEAEGRIFGKHPLLQRLGDASYALYLIHVPFISVLAKTISLTGFTNLGLGAALLSYVAILLLSLYAATVFHRLIEKPLLRTLRGWTLSQK